MSRDQAPKVYDAVRERQKYTPLAPGYTGTKVGEKTIRVKFMIPSKDSLVKKLRVVLPLSLSFGISDKDNLYYQGGGTKSKSRCAPSIWSTTYVFKDTLHRQQ
jgi:hypothetical protein